MTAVMTKRTSPTIANQIKPLMTKPSTASTNQTTSNAMIRPNMRRTVRAGSPAGNRSQHPSRASLPEPHRPPPIASAAPGRARSMAVGYPVIVVSRRIGSCRKAATTTTVPRKSATATRMFGARSPRDA